MTASDTMVLLEDIMDNIEVTQEALYMFRTDNKRARSYVDNADGCLNDALQNLRNAIAELEVEDE